MEESQSRIQFDGQMNCRFSVILLMCVCWLLLCSSPSCLSRTLSGVKQFTEADRPLASSTSQMFGCFLFVFPSITVILEKKLAPLLLQTVLQEFFPVQIFFMHQRSDLKRAEAGSPLMCEHSPHRLPV